MVAGPRSLPPDRRQRLAAPPLLAPAPGQRVLQTWHGTPLKRLALHRPGLRSPPRGGRSSRSPGGGTCCSRRTPTRAGILRKAYAFLTRPIWVEGYPRNDVLSTGDGAATRAALGIGDDERVLLYAPTWRDDRSEIVDFVDSARRSRAETDAVVLVRGHSRTLQPGRDTAGARRDRRHGLPRHLRSCCWPPMR